MKKLWIVTSLILITCYAMGQDPIVSVDGFFLKISKTEAIKFIGIDKINDTLFIEPDSAKVLLGDYGNNGIFVVKTKTPKDQVMNNFGSVEKLILNHGPSIYINDSLATNFNLNSIDPKKVDSTLIVTPLSSAVEYGPTMADGIIKIWLKNNEDFGDQIFFKTDIQPEFPGGDAKMKEFNQK